MGSTFAAVSTLPRGVDARAVRAKRNETKPFPAAANANASKDSSASPVPESTTRAPRSAQRAKRAASVASAATPFANACVSTRPTSSSGGANSAGASLAAVLDQAVRCGDDALLETVLRRTEPATVAATCAKLAPSLALPTLDALGASAYARNDAGRFKQLGYLKALVTVFAPNLVDPPAAMPPMLALEVNRRVALFIERLLDEASAGNL